jgi:photosystem II stability/assembly factor-like uncharacterized protein
MASRLLVGTRKGLFIVGRHARGEWRIDRAEILGDPVTMTLAERDGTLHAAQDMGHFGVKIKRSRDNGATWEERSVPQYPPKPDDVVDVDPMRNTPIPWNVMKVWALEVSSRPGELWCGTIPGGLFRSRDGGDSWQLVENLWKHPDRKFWVGGGADYPGIHSILIDPRSPDIVRLGISCGGLWLTTDGGKSWDCKGQGMRADYAPPDQAYERRGQDAHRLAQCKAAPDHIWIQHHNGIFLSTDGGLTCTEIKNAKPSVFGFPVVVHPEDPRTAWFVPGKKDERRYPVDGALVVSCTRDGGESFEILREGLPQQHAYDVVYRHALDLDADGTTLAFGSTTGNLFVSENQGASWRNVSSYLPPIYSVRFAN